MNTYFGHKGKWQTAVLLHLLLLAFTSISLFAKTDDGLSRKRAAVIVLAYNSDAFSFVGASLFETNLRWLLADQYQEIFIARDKPSGLDKKEIQDAFQAALNTGLTVDFMSSTHSNSKTIRLNKTTTIRPFDLLGPVVNPSNAGQLGFALNFGCYGASQWSDFRAIGFKSYGGYQGVSTGALAMEEFLIFLTKACLPLTGAAKATNEAVSFYLNHDPVAKTVYKQLSNIDVYTAELEYFGEDVSLCGY